MQSIKNEEISFYYSNIITNPEKILEYLHLGISIPILPEFKKYIIGDIKAYNAKAIILKKKNNKKHFTSKTVDIIGIVLVYEDDSQTLFFGFFGVYDHDPKKIEYLIDKLIEYAKINNYKIIRGPINIPTVIFGWGFMVEGSKKDIFIGSPINPPIYQEIFLKKGFEILFQEDRYELKTVKLNPHEDKKLISMGINNGNYEQDFFDTGDYPYEYFNPEIESLLKVKEQIIKMYDRYMPPSFQITPKRPQNAVNIINFINEFGASWMKFLVRHKETKELVANGYILPNVFNKNKKGELNSVCFQAWVVHPKHRRKHLTLLMHGFTITQAMDRKTPHYIKRGLWPVDSNNLASVNSAKKLGGIKNRSHLILEYLF